jgi:hypothetical protein
LPEPNPEEYLNVQSTSSIVVPGKISNPKKIEAVSVCVGYADVLVWTLPFNKTQFDRLVIVTSPEDKETQRLCEYWHVETVVTDVFYENADVFNKGKGIKEGLKRLGKDGWVLHFDSDIYTLPSTREVLNLLPLDEKGVYSADRINCVGFANWAKYIQSPELAHANTGFLGMNAFENGARLLNLGRDGYVPIGYFQLWNPQGSGVTEYPRSTVRLTGPTRSSRTTGLARTGTSSRNSWSSIWSRTTRRWGPTGRAARPPRL